MTKRRRGHVTFSRPADGMAGLGPLRFWLSGLVRPGKHAGGGAPLRTRVRSCGTRRKLARRRKVRRRMVRESRRKNRT